MTGDKTLDSLLLLLNEKASANEAKFGILLLDQFPLMKEGDAYDLQFTWQMKWYEVYLAVQLSAFTSKKIKDIGKMHRHFRENALGWESVYKRMARILPGSTEYSIMKTRVQRMIEILVEG